MTEANVTYSGVKTTSGSSGTLFAGQKFWFSSTVPQKSWFKENVEANGGIVVQLEKQADVKLVDHKRKNPAPGTHSYKYVEHSLRNGQLENLDDHVAGPPEGTVRPVGSVTMASRGGRTPFTAGDDQFLYDWIKPLQGARGELGNEIYKQIEQINPRHTFQSWRDRWIKYVSKQQRQLSQHQNAATGGEAPGPSPRRSQAATPNSKRHREPATGRADFTAEDAQTLMDEAEDILAIDPTDEDAAWSAWANTFPQHTAQEWKYGWETKVLPTFRAKIKAGKQRSLNKTSGDKMAASPSRTAVAEFTLQASDTSRKTGSQEAQHTRDSILHRSPSFQSESGMVLPSNIAKDQDTTPKATRLSKTLATSLAPTANELPPIVNLERSPSPKRKRNEDDERAVSSSPQLPPSATPRRKKIRTKPPPDIPLEIPSTPEAETIVVGSKGQHRGHEPDLEPPESPLFLPDVVADPIEAVQEPATSPLGLKLFSDSQGDQNAEEAHSRSPTPRRISHESTEDDVFETAPEDDIFETAPQVRGVDTQMIFARGETQIPDFALPELPSSPPVADTEPSDKNSSRLDAWIETTISEGFDEAAVLDAVFRTSGNTVLAETVVKSLTERKGIPSDMKGVWTDQDDASLVGSDGREIRRVQEKHRVEAFNQRFEFLEVYRGAED